MKQQTLQSLASELNSLKNQVRPLASRVEGRKFLEAGRHGSAAARDLSPAFWALVAHEGTLEKVADILPIGDAWPETFELLAVARNLFENLVWLRLLDSDVAFGLVFYAQLLRGQQDNCRALLTKMEEEAALFDVAEGIDTHSVQEMVDTLNPDDRGDEHRASWNSQLDTRTKTLDAMVRSEFSLYAGQAIHNGYGYQAYLLRNNEIPRCQEQLTTIEAFKATLDAALPGLLDSRLLNMVHGKWNWYARAEDVSMAKHYRFIYGFTSRLLHSTPISLVTEKALAEQEKLLVLDYIVLAVRDLLDLIQKFSYPGMPDIAIVAIDESAPT